ncbi:MAG: carboxypeptidase-like regulatory domain-containing protein [Myxococcota bacterium]
MRRMSLVMLLPLVLVRCQCEDELSAVDGSITGKVCDIRTGKGAAGITAAVELPGSGRVEAVSEAGGAFSMKVPSGTYDVVITQTLEGGRTEQRTIPGVEVRSDEETVMGGDPACLAEETPDGTCWVRGRVCNRHTGMWVGNAVVVVSLPDGTVIETATDAEGNFRLEGVPEGEHVVAIQSATYQRAYAVTCVAEQESLLASVAECRGVDPVSGGVEGLMCAPNGTGPMTNALAYIDVDGVRVSDALDLEGHFILTGIPPGRRELVIQQDAYVRRLDVDIMANQIVRVGPTVCTAPDPDSTGCVEGMLCNPGANGGALVGATVLLDVPGGTLEDSTDELGRFRFCGVEAGDHLIRVPGEQETTYSVTVQAGQTASVIPQAVCDEPDVTIPPGEVRGRICAPNGTTWLANARVWVELADGGVIESQTDPEGRFTLTGVPVGTYTVNVAAGSFTTTIPGVEVRENEITQVGDTPDECVPLEDRKIAVVTGAYDKVQVVLGRLGLNQIDLYHGGDSSSPLSQTRGDYRTELLGNYERMQEYEVIFFNCGMDDTFLADAANRQVAIDNLRAFVASGKSVYASDWAYDLVEVAWPDFVDFHEDDGNRNLAQVGDEGENVTASVTDAALRNALGTAEVSINFNLQRWALVSNVSSGTTVYIRGNVVGCVSAHAGPCTNPIQANNAPLTVGFHPSADSGKVIYTSFHQEEQGTQDMDTILELMVFEL